MRAGMKGKNLGSKEPRSEKKTQQRHEEVSWYSSKRKEKELDFF